MPDALEDVVYAVGDAIVAPGLGHGELILAFVVALAFAGSAVKTWRRRGTREGWRERRF
jgi:hypothetical protein